MALFYETIHTVNVIDYTPEQITAWAPTPPEEMDYEAWAERLGSKHTLVAESSNGLLIGFANLEQMDGVEGSGHIDQFFGHKDFQGIGVGKALLLAIEEEAIRQDMTRLLVEASITAKPFFERHDFRTIAQQTVERFGIDLTNYRMAKRLVRVVPFQTFGAGFFGYRNCNGTS
jgi:GNAT superfamily N-acetyltransferase